LTKSNKSLFASILRVEFVTLALLGLVGVLLLPLMIYVVGAEIFGDYAGNGFGDFYRSIHSDLRGGQPVVIFLVVSPYFVWQLLRLSFFGFRRLKSTPAPERPRVDPEIR
jgi:hypothetical protein